MLLDRNELTKLKVIDRETDPKNPVARNLSDAEIERYLINTMIGSIKLPAPAVRQRIEELAKSDPSPRVRAAALRVLQGDSHAE